MSMEPLFFSLKVYGIVIVISFLCAFIIWVIVHALTAFAKKPVATALSIPNSASPVPAAADDEIPPEHIAAIAAAVHFLSGETTILRIEADRRGTAWVAEGRLVHHSSHNPIRNR